MSNHRGWLSSTIIVLDTLLLGVVPLLMAVIIYVSLIVSPYSTWLPTYLSNEWTESLLYWYVPAELLSITVCGVFGGIVHILNILVLATGVLAWRGSQRSRILLALLTIGMSLFELAALRLLQIYGQSATGVLMSSNPLVTRLLFVVLLAGLNLGYLILERRKLVKASA